MTTKERAASASKGLPVNHCSGFRSPSFAVLPDVDGITFLNLLICSTLTVFKLILYLLDNKMNFNKYVSTHNAYLKNLILFCQEFHGRASVLMLLPRIMVLNQRILQELIDR